MFRMLLFLIVAVMAMMTLAAPAPTKTIQKRSFAAKVKGHGKHSGKEALERAARKYGFKISFPESTLEERHWDLQDLKDAWPSGWPWPWASSSAQANDYGFPSASAIASGFSSNVPAPSGGFSILPSVISALPSGFSAEPSGFSSVVVPSDGFSSSAVASSGAPPAQSSAPASQPAAPSASAPAPSSSSSPGGGDDSGTVSADPADQNESQYLSPVTIGGNQQLNLDFDTGSSDLWVFNAQSNTGHTAFDPSKSSTFTEYQGGSWEISYGDGSTASGTVGFDTVTIGGVTAQKQAIELADQVSSTFSQNTANDGLLGLAFGSINQVRPQKQKTFFENVMDELEQPLFTADLEEDSSGTYEFGTIDQSKYTGDIHYSPVDNSAGFWQIESGSFSVGGTEHDCSNCDPTIVDTGTSLLIMDDDIVQAYYAQVSGAQLSNELGGYVYQCGTDLPDFGVAIGSGYTAVIKGADMTYAEAGNGLCYGGIQPGGSQAGVNILGDVLLKQFFAVFDAGNMQVGIAEKP